MHAQQFDSAVCHPQKIDWGSCEGSHVFWPLFFIGLEQDEVNSRDSPAM